MRIIQGLLLILIILLAATIWYSATHRPEIVVEAPEGMSRLLEPSQIANVMDNLKSSVFETITASETAKGLTAANLTHTTHGTAYAARISVDGDLRIVFDGSTPTFTVGEELHDTEANYGPVMVYWPDNLANVQFINDTTGTSATVNVHYFYIR
jgi:hypothetical protein